METIVDFLTPLLTTTIILLIILGTLNQYKANSRRDEEKRKNEHCMLVLIVDDLGKDLTNPSNFLRKKYQVIVASSVEEAKNLLIKEQPKYALIDLELSGTDQSEEFDGIQLFKFIFEKKLSTKPVVVSSHSFEVTKPYFEKHLKELCGDKLESELKDIQDNYIDKLSSYNCLQAIEDKLETLERASKSAKEK